jgi:hypothetical protein
MTPQEKAEQAKQVLTNPVFKHVYGDIRENLVVQLESIPLGDTETQHEITLMLQLLKRVQTTLERYQQSGTVEKHRAKQDSFIERVRERLV